MGTAQQLLIGGGGGSAASDPYFASVVLLCHADGADGTGPPINVVEPLGRGDDMASSAALFDTAQALYGASSLKHQSNPSYGLSASHTDYAFGTNDFTIELALYGNAVSTRVIFDMRPAASEGAYAALSMNSSGNLFYYVSSSTRITGTAVLTSGAWQRVAVSRVSGTTRMFVDGTQVGSSWTDSTTYLQSRIVIGAQSKTLGSDPFNGWSDEIRITNGVGRYSGNYTVATAAFPDS